MFKQFSILPHTHTPRSMYNAVAMGIIEMSRFDEEALCHNVSLLDVIISVASMGSTGVGVKREP